MPTFEELFPGLASVVSETRAVAGYLWEKGWAERNAGNLSVDVTGLVDAGVPVAATPALEFAYPDLDGRVFLVTGSGSRYRDFARNPAANACVARVRSVGLELLWDGGRGFRPTSEFPSHLRVHEFLRQSGDAARAVLHTHPTELIAMTHMSDYAEQAPINRALWSIHPEVKVAVPRGLGLVPYTLPGSEMLAQATVAVLRRGFRAAMWSMHGCVAVGEDIAAAFDIIDTLNKAAKLVLLCRSAGHVPEGLTAEQLTELVRAFGVEE